MCSLNGAHQSCTGTPRPGIKLEAPSLTIRTVLRALRKTLASLCTSEGFYANAMYFDVLVKQARVQSFQT